MPKSYVDKIVSRYLMKKGYLASQGTWFLLERQKTRKKVSGWSDIDIFGVKDGEPSLIIQCKSFSGTESSEKFIERIINWFNNALNYLENHPDYNGWVKDNKYKKVFVVDASVRKTEKIKKEWDRSLKLQRYFKRITKKLKKNKRL